MSGRLVCLASYPKSGNTWLRAMLSAWVQQDGSFDINAMSFGAHASRRDWIDAASGLRSGDFAPEEAALLRRETLGHIGGSPGALLFLKTHDANLPLADGQPVFRPAALRLALCPIRHPYDVALSLAHHLGRSDDLDGVVALMCDPAALLSPDEGDRFAQPLSDWSGNVRSWASTPRAHLFRYEDMLADPGLALRRAVRLCWPDDGDPDDARVARVVQETGFDRLRAQEAAHSFAERPPTAARFFRSGRAGGGGALAPELRRRLWAAHGEVMAHYGYHEDGATGPWHQG